MTTIYSLSQLGWSPFFQQQISLDEWEHFIPARVTANHRSEIELVTESGKHRLSLLPSMPALAVGDWILLDSEMRFQRMLERASLFSRKAAGSKVASQLIAANVDTVFVVCSLNNNFSLNRIERYLALVKDAGVEPLVVLTKADLVSDPQQYVRQVQAFDSMLMVEAVNALDPDNREVLMPWCRAGKTVALLGSSGVGKSTLVNMLMGVESAQTGGIRADDDKGRHTTTACSMHFMSSGGNLLDTPGMRELQLADCEQGVEQTFAEIGELAERCRYADCQHRSEPGCALRAAINAGQLDERRLDSYLKLMREQAFNSASLAEKRERDRNLGRFYRTAKRHASKRKKGDSYS